MKKLNKEELEQWIRDGFEIMSDEIEELIITNREGWDIGIPREIADRFIAGKVEENSTRFSAMDDDEFSGYVEKLSREARERMENHGDLEEMIEATETRDMRNLARLHFLTLNRMIEKIFFMKNTIERNGIDASDLTEALFDKFRETEEYYYGLSDEEFNQAVMAKHLRNIMEGMDDAEAAIQEKKKAS